MTMTLKFNRFGLTESIDIPTFAEAETLPEASREYAWTYGLRQSLSDSFAGAKTAAEFSGALKKRWDAIKAGTVGQRTRESDPVKAMELRVAAETFNAQPLPKRKAAIAKALAKLPKGTDEAEAISAICGLLAETDGVKAEAKRRLDAKAAAPAIDLESLVAEDEEPEFAAE